MQSKQVAHLIECLEGVRERPAMYLGDVEINAAMHFLHGVQIAAAAWVGNDIDVRNQVIADRGWRLNALGPAKEMLERGYSAAQVVDEMLAIEIESIRRLADR